MKAKLFLLAMVTIALAGCTDDLERRSSYSPEGGLQATIPAYPFDGGTRVSISDDLQTFTWSNGDQIGIYYLDGDITAHAGFGIVSGGGTTGTFTNSAFALHPSSTYYGFFPFDENASVSSAPVDFTGQVQTVNGSAAHLGAKNYMYSVVNTDGNGNARINFHNLGSVMAIRLYAPETGTYSRLEVLSDDANFYQFGYARMNDGIIESGGGSNEMTLSFGTEGLSLNAGEVMSLYLLVAPVDMSTSNLTFTLYSSNASATPYTVGTLKGKVMNQGRAYLYDLTNRDAPYVTFTADATQTLQLSQEVPSLEYSVNGGTWTTLGTNTVTFGDTKGTLRLRGKSLKGTQGATVVFGNETKVACSGDICTLVDYENYETVNTSEAVFIQLFQECTQLTSAPRLPSLQLAPQCYLRMFIGCTSLTQAPDLPATTLTPLCYYSMFQQCTSLTTLPELPAMVMADRCYNFMFAGCKFNTAPELPATVLANGCYNGMFYGCTSLFTAPELPATVMADGCYQQMFAQCSSLTEAPGLPAMELAQTCYAGMFRNCTSLTTAPDLPALELVQGCYTQMFYGCTSLNYIEMMAVDCGPQFISQWVNNVASSGTFVKNKIATWDESGIVPAGWTVETMDGTPYVTFTSNTVQTLRMSQEVSSLQYSVNGGTWSTLGTSIVTFGGMNGDIRLRGKSSVGTNGATITFGYTTPVTCSGDIRTLVDYENYDTANTSQAVFKELFKDCTQLTTAPRLPATTLADYCYESMFRGCTSLTQAPKLPATTLAYAAYHCMFQNCSSLTTAPELPATNLESAVYQSMFGGCTSLTTAPELPATTLASSCYGDMFAGCISLTRAPELPARTLAPACYISMFAGCQNLNYIKMMATDISAIMCLTSWVSNVSSTGTFVKNAAATWNVTGVNGIPEGWTVQTASE